MENVVPDCSHLDKRFPCSLKIEVLQFEPNPMRLGKTSASYKRAIILRLSSGWNSGVGSVRTGAGNEGREEKVSGSPPETGSLVSGSRERMKDLRHSWRSAWVLPAALH